MESPPEGNAHKINAQLRIGRVFWRSLLTDCKMKWAIIWGLIKTPKNLILRMLHYWIFKILFIMLTKLIKLLASHIIFYSFLEFGLASNAQSAWLRIFWSPIFTYYTESRSVIVDIFWTKQRLHGHYTINFGQLSWCKFLLSCIWRVSDFLLNPIWCCLELWVNRLIYWNGISSTYRGCFMRWND